MKFIGIILTISGLIIIIYPQIIAYMLGGLLLFFGINILLANFVTFKKGTVGKDYVAFGKYKIYKE